MKKVGIEGKKWDEKTDVEIFQDLRKWIEDRDTVFSKEDVFKKIDRAFPLMARDETVVSAVHLLREIEDFLVDRDDKNYLILILEELKSRYSNCFEDVYW